MPETTIITQPNIWHSTWGAIGDISSIPPIGWDYNVVLSVWEYVGPTADQINMTFKTSSASCNPDANTYSSYNQG
jgi:hypothetical protein|tara:strand:- start:7222 stop:7446 length:225 start_codon:yes stop_codon:yes gene_type:complete